MPNDQTYLVFDIETVAKDFESFDESQREYLLRGASTDEERQRKINELALSPFTAEIVCIGMAVIEGTGTEWRIVKEGVLATDKSLDPGGQESSEIEGGVLMARSDEATVLRNFWRVLQAYPSAHLISFNGRGFDAPFLMLRSALCQIRPGRNLMQGTKWNYLLHTDLADELSYFGFGSSGPTRRFNFDFYARAFGITSPKAHGIDGSKVQEYYQTGRLQEIAEYCLRDVQATWELFLVWKKYLDFK